MDSLPVFPPTLASLVSSLMHPVLRLGACVALILLCWGAVWAVPIQTPQSKSGQRAYFEQKVLPILKESCFKCHGTGKTRGGLKLTNREAILQGGDTGPAVDLKNPRESLLLKAVQHQDGLEMPPTGRLPAAKIKVLEDWVKAGIPWSAAANTEPGTGRPKLAGGIVTPDARAYWAYQPVQRPAVPSIKQRDWVSNPIDAFILARLEAKGLSPTSPADRLALIRRVTYDLTGLPPTPEEIDDFLRDASRQAYEQLIDRLLASPHYGEKWGRHWLDVVRYAETNGYERDSPKPYAWRFRDYVIKSFNDDRPFDQFVREQLAGDELPGFHPEAVIATGYYRLGLWDDEPADPKQARMDQFDDIVATTAQGFLGMTMNCARCHEHKIDPIPHADYYRFLAFFADLSPYSNDRNVRSSFNLTDITPPERRKRYEEEYSHREREMGKLQQDLTILEDQVIRRMPAEDQRAAEGMDREVVIKKIGKYASAEQQQQYDALKQQFKQLKDRAEPVRDLALSVNHCKVNPPPTFVMIRGNAHSPGQRVSPGYPSVLTDNEPRFTPPTKDAPSSGRRTVLANWIASKQNPLTARVFVNRLWQHHFGRGIVTSSNDFGKFGTLPTHPELLDWLAADFTAGGWKVKRMHKLILLSSAYQMSSRGNEAGWKTDPENTLFWRFNPRRLTAEEVRDSILAVSGQLNPGMYGPSVYPPLPKEVLAGQSRPGEGWGKATAEQAARRSVYIHVKRSLQVPILATHDQADTDSSCPVRYTTTVPTQALGLLNGQFSQEQAEAFALRLQREYPDDAAAQVTRAIRLTTGRGASNKEAEKDVAFLAAMRLKHGMNAMQALKHYCLLLLNANEFVYLD